jgi:tetratricopeptide (TPR) repeat protein
MKTTQRLNASLCAALAGLVLMGTAGCDTFVGADQRVARAEALLDKGAYSEALLELKNALAKEPKHARALIGVVRGHLQLGQFEAATKALATARAAGVAATELDPLQAKLLLATGKADDLLKAFAAGSLDIAADEKRQLEMRALGAVNRCDEAMAIARELVAKDSNQSKARLVLAECLTRRANLPAALATLEAGRDADAKSAELWLAIARVQQLRGDRAASQAALQKTADLAPAQLSIPEQVVVYSALADAVLGREDLAGLKKTRDAVLAAVPSSVVAEYLGANVALLEGKTDEAIATLQKLLTGDATFRPARALLASALLAKGTLEQTRQETSTLLRESPGVASLRLASQLSEKLEASQNGTESYWLTTAGVHAALGQPAMARLALGQAAKIAPESKAVALATAQLNLRTGDVDAARASLADMEKRFPDEPQVLALRAEVHGAAREHAEAAAALEALAAKQPSAAIAAALFQARSRAGLPNAHASLERWLVDHPKDHSVRQLYADALRVAGNSAGAAAELEKVIADQPDNVAALNNLAWVYYLARDSRAVATSRRAYQRAPKVPEVADTHGWLLVEAGSLKEGIEVLEAANASAGAVQGEIRFHLAAALARAGERERAVGLLKDILTNAGPFPSQSQAAELLRSLG